MRPFLRRPSARFRTGVSFFPALLVGLLAVAPVWAQAPLERFSISPTETALIDNAPAVATESGLHSLQDPSTRIMVIMGVTAQSGLQVTDKTYVSFDDRASTGFDNGLDAYKLRNIGEIPSFSSLVGVDELAINTLPTLAQRTVVPLSLTIKIAKSYALAAFERRNFPPDLHVYLRDSVASINQDLTVDTSYVVALDTGTYNRRFSLIFEPGVAPSGIAASAAGPSLQVWPNPAAGAAWVRVGGVADASVVTLLDALGRVVRTGAVVSQTNEAALQLAGLPAGVYTVRANLQTRPLVVE